MEKIKITVKIDAPLEEVWEKYTEEKHIVNWNFASNEWHCPSSTNDLTVGGQFSNRMEAKDGSFGFDFEGTYTEVEHRKLIAYKLEDSRMVSTQFSEIESSTQVTTLFDPENQNPIDMQRDGWQAILYNFKKYVESNA